MSLPKHPEKHSHPSLFTARDLTGPAAQKRGREFPDAFILCYQGNLFDYAARRYRGRAVKMPFGEPRVLRPKGGLPVGLAGGFGIGAPVAVFVLEWLAAHGVHRFLSLGAAGGLHETQEPGDLVVCTRALRDEGTSYHYLPPADYSLPDLVLTEQFRGSLTELGYAQVTGGTWTTDAPLRETQPEIERWRAAGLLTVEMEAAALFAAAEYLDVSCAAAFTIADSPKDGRWQVRYNREARNKGLRALADAGVKLLGNP